MKIGFVSLDHLRDWTGITRLIDRIAFDMTCRGHEVTLIACAPLKNKAASKAPVSERSYPHALITLDLDSAEGRTEAREKIKVSGLDICAASIGNTNLLYMPWLFYKSGIPFIVGDPADPRVFTYQRWSPYEHYGAVFGADAVQVLLEEYAALYPEALRERITVIGNPAPPPADVDFEARRCRQTRTIIAVGRFNEDDKRYSLLLRAFAALCKDFPEWRLKLVGDGPFWEYYHIMAEQLGIKKLVEFTGAVSDADPHYNAADIFCLPSLYAEGLPMVFGEASSHALPMVGFKTCTASAALITSEIGALADNAEGGDYIEILSGALRQIMLMPPEEREVLGENCRNFFQKRYGGGVIFGQWETLLAETLEKTRKHGKTMLERMFDMDLGKEWDGLTPDSPVWSESLLAAATAEIIAREEPTKPPLVGDPADPENGDGFESFANAKSAESAENATNAEIVRLKCENAQLKRDLGELGKKHSALMAQFHAAARKKRR